MYSTSQTITNILNRQIPDYVEEYYPLFVIFVTKYFEFLENTSTGVQHQLQNIQLNRDIDTTADNLAQQFLHTYVPNLPDTSAVDRSILVKYFRDFYQRKGSESSFKFFFRAFFNDEIDIVKPRDFMFDTSGANWYVENSIRVRANVGDPLNLEHNYISGVTSRARAVVDNIVKVSGVGGDDYYDLILQKNSWTGTFTSGEAISAIVYADNNTTSLVTVTSISARVTASGYYKNSRSHLSNNQVLQDSLYYQQFSYVIRTRQDRETWADHVLKYLNPTGLVMFNEFLSDTVSTNKIQTQQRTNKVETSVKIPTIKSYLTAPTFTFDRIADVYTGTSATVTAGAIVYDAAYDYNGENVTWALQKDGDSSSVTEIIRFGGPSFDKFSRSVGVNDQIITWPIGLNSSIATTRISLASSNLTAGTLVTSFSTTIETGVSNFPTATSVGSMLLTVTWLKNTRGNNAAGESANAVIIYLSSNTTLLPRFDTEVQRNFREVALGRSLEYNKLSYTHSSNSITANNVTSGLPLSSTTTNASFIFRPYNWERGLTYDRISILIDVDQSLQLNTSLTETFNTADITSAGLIASWSSTTTSVSVNYFGTDSSNARYAFSSNCFVFNGPTGDIRYVQTTSFLNTQRLDLTVSYIVGDGYNGGDIPETGEDLEVQYSNNGGASWFVAAKLWNADDVWTYGQTNLSGSLWCEAGSSYVTGNNTLFRTQLAIGDIITINSSTTTAYTVTNVINNNVIAISPALVTQFRTTTAITGTVQTSSGSVRVTGTGTTFTALALGDYITIGSSTTTAYAVVNVISDTVLDISQAATVTTSGLTVYQISGTVGYRKLPTAQQLKTTSLTVYGPGASFSSILRIIQTGTGTLGQNEDSYAIENLKVDSFRFQSTTGTVNIGIAVSSNSTLNISDTDFFDVTTVGAG